MFAKVFSGCVLGIEGKRIEVEVDLSNGLPLFHLVGLPDSAVRESVERVRSAIKNSGFEFPLKRITINLAPADIRKEGSTYDLAIAVGILAASGQIFLPPHLNCIMVGELALDGRVRPVPGILPMADIALRNGSSTLLIPAENQEEASLVQGIRPIPIRHLKELCRGNVFDASRPAEQASGKATGSLGSKEEQPPAECGDYADVRGQHHAKRALMIAAAGLHNLLFIGPPGSGKTMLMRRLPGILPELSESEALEVTKIYSVSNQFVQRKNLIRQRPFRSPHHTTSNAGMTGGGSVPRPGEISLAHRGVLYLDEIAEFSRSVLETLRQPLEENRVTIARARAVYSYPSDFLLAASMNPCPCGYYGGDDDTKPCKCTPPQIRKYRSKISGPLLDRIDMQVAVSQIRYETLNASGKEWSTKDMQARVKDARAMQDKRYRMHPTLQYNSQLSGRELRKYCPLQADTRELLGNTFLRLKLSMRAHDRILKLSRTIADLEGSTRIEYGHLAEAIRYRVLDQESLM